MPLTKVGIFQEFKHLLLLQGAQLFHGQKSCVEKKQGCHEKVCSHCFFCKEVNQECGRQIKLLAGMLLKIREPKMLQADKTEIFSPTNKKGGLLLWVLPLSVAIYWGTMAVIRSCAVASDIYVAFNFSLFFVLELKIYVGSLLNCWR